MVFSLNTIRMRADYHQQVCDQGLVYTGIVLELPIAMPGNAQVAAGISVYIQTLAQQGISFSTYLAQHFIEDQCSYRVGANEEDPLKPLTMQNLAGPFILLALGMGSALTMTACRRLRGMGSVRKVIPSGSQRVSSC